MKEYLNENTLFNTVAMFLQENGDLLLVLEGADDHLLLKAFCTPELVLMAATGGRAQVLGAAKLAQSRGLDRVRFLVDRDYDAFSGCTDAHIDNVFISQFHDLFTDLIAADDALLSRVIEVHAASAYRRPEQKKLCPAPADVQTEAITLASGLAAMRIVDARRSMFLDFKRFSFGGLSAQEFGVRKIAEIVLIRSEYADSDRDNILDEVESTHAEISELDYCPVGDHDLFSAVARILTKYGVHVSKETLHRGYILGVSCASLSRTTWYREIQSWCGRYGIQGFVCERDDLAA